MVSNISLAPALAKHRARRENDKNSIMTMILRDAWSDGLPRSRRHSPIFVLDPRAERCLHYEEVGGKGASRYITLEPEFLTAHAEIDVRDDLTDPHIDICTPDVLALWSENFDYGSLRKSFLFGVLKDYELNGKMIHTHLVRDEYAARVSNLRAYDSISADLLRRRVYPFCPDSNLLRNQTYRSSDAKLYREDSVEVARSAKFSGICTIGGGTQIGDKAHIVNSTLGRRCTVGDGAWVENAQLWDDVSLEDQVKIAGPTVIANGVQIESEAIISPGSVISYGARVGRKENISGLRARDTKNDTQRTIQYENDSDASSDASLNLIYQSPSASSSKSSISTITSSDDFEPLSDTSRRSSFVSDPSEEGTSAASKDFLVEATASILDGLAKNDSPDTIFLELNGYRMSVDASQHQVRHALAAACVKRAIQLSEESHARDAVKAVFETYLSLFERTILDKDEEEKADQVDLLLLVQKELEGKANSDQFMLIIAKQLYDLDIVEEEGVLQWWDDPKSEREEMARVRALTEHFVTFLREAEEDGDSDEEEQSE